MIHAAMIRTSSTHTTATRIMMKMTMLCAMMMVLVVSLRLHSSSDGGNAFVSAWTLHSYTTLSTSPRRAVRTATTARSSGPTMLLSRRRIATATSRSVGTTAATAAAVIDDNIMPAELSFEELSRLDNRLSTLEEEATNGGTGGFLMDYYDPTLNSFSISPGRATFVSITSTAYAVRCLLEQDPTSPSSSSSLLASFTTKSRMVRTLLQSDWRPNDLYQVSLIMLVVLRLDPTLECMKKKNEKNMGSEAHAESGVDEDRAKLAQLIKLVLSGRPERRRGERQRFSSYIQYLCATVYGDLMRIPQREQQRRTQVDSSERNADDDDDDEKIGEVTSIIDELVHDKLLSNTTKRDINLAVTRSAEISHMEFCRQLAYRSAGEKSLFDVIKMIYSMLTYLKSTEALRDATRSQAKDTGREVVELLDVTIDDMIVSSSSTSTPMGDDDESEGDTSSGSVYTVMNLMDEEKQQEQQGFMLQLNPKLVQAGLKAFFEEQDADDGLWDRGQPIYKSFRRKGRNIGNAYVFGVDALGSLLEMLQPDQFRQYVPNLERTLQWMENNLRTDVVPDYCDPYTGKCYGKVLRGWASSHLLSSPPPGNGPKAWSTAQTLTCLSRMRQVVREILHQDVLNEFRGRPLSKNGPSDVAWNRLLDSDIGSQSAADDTNNGSARTTIKAVLENRVTTPFTNGANTPSVGAAYSTILFGSPGTAKTTITEAVADKLGWDFLTIDTAVFLEDGLGNVASRIRYVFRRLEALRNCVILFDEIEEFCLDRETPGISMESRMLTTAMLTAINDLRRRKQSIFFLATNRLRAFDAAIIRPGRFDMQLFVGTPNLQSRVILLNQALESTGVDLSPTTREDIIETYTTFLEEVWTRDAMFFNYLEGKQFASSVASIVAANQRVSRGDLQRLLSQQAAVMTARGSVRDEYIAQMNLSRL